MKNPKIIVIIAIVLVLAIVVGAVIWLVGNQGNPNPTEPSGNTTGNNETDPSNNSTGPSNNETNPTNNSTGPSYNTTEPTTQPTEPKPTEPAPTDPTTDPSITWEKVDETVYPVANIHVFAGPDYAFINVMLLEEGTPVKRTGIGSNGWSRLEINGVEVYAHSSVLTLEKP